ncbi:hypothetical protein A3C98_04170 [Candidatus Roizmanbacteria bacterium RIFCSPHIGHO2_02_FULL_37_15]|uniref:YprB ribonuclease H-like domain-containing protein n=1 Tax=Candidatus Roizmanbacteria bacterium RIFCSPLOWO2_01_FULL_37_16 TaxID=1802058 RepID=A0A1F7IM66_9BACT|nr:MAG: hypothetical protein A2859_01750 [Candidatus Roizmanbacteria bacterium RIFCSPHIGHO2_01_FULL_37_16b]OGK22852.1 MAG: hypothetical protein A3C98_04170 [Candidatus Roizmanbacteria bacterium RIFCSPHIGHO2_02_FULL_37_15]OGK44474.1 MAG: hypothetical protein A3B40_01655 [Candidatus Roizmanbacteria bacterium RIFCSPLOWO2_01_FULL_37_16]OGK55950.1 MAG: hypothetical protein A3I50_04430 [Candidatus Roizmanbacteria bacterium RIFCSPLOWO2_02_FULL_37_9]
MRKFPVIIDLETKYSFREYNDPKKLGVTTVGLYDYRDQQNKIFVEKELSRLFPLLEASSYIIGFNVRSFDLPVLQGYYPGKLQNFPIFDILEDIKNKIGKRLSLNDLVFATLGKKKSGHGLIAIQLYQEGKWEDLKKYCLDDVMLTKELFEFGVRQGEVMYLNEKGKSSIKVDWKKYLKDQGRKESHLTLPF